MARKRPTKEEEFLASLADGSLYSMGAFFSDQHPELVDEVIAQAEAMEQRGLRGYAEDAGMSVEEAYETLMTGLAVRYYNAVAG
jgi:dolichyl-phosphate-mannose--protein O-mannosyl transferase